MQARQIKKACQKKESQLSEETASEIKTPEAEVYIAAPINQLEKSVF